MTLKWHFATTDLVEDDGFHDPLRETFEGDHERYVARETIQNSIDARFGEQAVRVHFERLLLPASRLPGRNEFADVLARAKEYNKGQERSAEFYDSALSMINSLFIPVLKISDFNTTGLNGSDQDKDGEWYRLIRATGASSMSGVGGGSFGIGKGAPFAASALHMVFYSTINEQGETAFQGKSRISSFISADGDVKRGIGLFGIDGVTSIRSAEEIPEDFRRNEQGTDIYIIGYMTEGEDWRRLLIQSVLSNFWAAIHFEDLIVSFSDEGKDIVEINFNNLEEFLTNYSSEEKDDPLYFYKALTEGVQIPGTLELLGECSLYVKKADGYPKMVQMMRKPKMVVKTTPPTAFRVLGEPFSAVFLCANEEGNKQLRLLEPPAHNEWDSNRHNDKKLGRRLLKEVNDFIRDSLRSLAQDAGNHPEEIPELSYLLPEYDELTPQTSRDGEPVDGKPADESGSETGAQKEPSEAKLFTVLKRKATTVKTGALGGNKKRLQDGGDGTRRGGDGSVDPRKPGDIPFIDTSKIRFRAREVRNDDKILYKAVITPASDEKGSLKIVAVGEDARYPLEIESVVTEEGGKIDFDGAVLKNIELFKDQPLKIYIGFKDNKRFAIGVENNGGR